MFGWPDPNTGFDQSEHALYTCYFITLLTSLTNLDVASLNVFNIGVGYA